MMNIRFSALMLLCMVSITAWGKNLPTVKGRVYQDDNRNGVFDKNEKPLPGISVSNGRDVVQTDAQGHYELPLDGRCEIFVIKPSGYSTPVDSRGLSQSYYLYRPDGSPTDTHFKGIAPTGKLPKTVDFALYPNDESDNFRILVFGDPQCRDRTDAGFLGQEVIKPLIDSAGAFSLGIVLGDVSFNGLDVFGPVMDRIGLVRIPWHVTPGNHDHNQDKGIADSLATESYIDFFGPATYAFNYGKVHFILADDIIMSNPEGKVQYTGGLTKKQLAFIENDLKTVPKDHLIVFGGHIHLFGSGAFRPEDRKRLFELLAPFEHTLSLSAHTHYIRQDFLDEKEGWTSKNPHLHVNAGATCADWYKGLPDAYGYPNAMMRDGSPQGYFTFDFQGNRYTFDYHPSRQADFKNMSISLDDSLKTGTSIPIFANFYNGNDRSELSFRIDGGQWTKMGKTVESDPTFARLSKMWNDPAYKLPGRKVSAPIPSHHLWKSEIPAFSSPGVHIAEVQAVDMFGRRYTEKLVFEVL